MELVNYQAGVEEIKVKVFPQIRMSMQIKQL